MFQTPTWPGLIGALLEGEDLSISDSTWAMEQVMQGEAQPAELAGFLVALRAKGETVDEIVGFRDAILEHALPLAVTPDVVDIVGTGGDRMRTVNVSTMAAVVTAAAGAKVVKHGNRAASSSSGSSDVLSALGVDLTLEPERVAQILDEVGITFVYAAAFHPGFRHAAPARSALGVPTVFNFLGPLCNPARPEANAVGVARAEVIPLIVGVFQTRGASALVFRGDDGLDELTTTGHSHIWEIASGAVTEHDLNPRELGIPRASLADLQGGTPEENAATARSVLGGAEGPVRDIVLLNAAAALAAWDLSHDPTEADRPMTSRLAARVTDAAAAIDSGAALDKLNAWTTATKR